MIYSNTLNIEDLIWLKPILLDVEFGGGEVKLHLSFFKLLSLLSRVLLRNYIFKKMSEIFISKYF
jgi:hypothetical protein